MGITPPISWIGCLNLADRSKSAEGLIRRHISRPVCMSNIRKAAFSESVHSKTSYQMRNGFVKARKAARISAPRGCFPGAPFPVNLPGVQRCAWPKDAGDAQPPDGVREQDARDDERFHGDRHYEPLRLHDDVLLLAHDGGQLLYGGRRGCAEA